MFAGAVAGWWNDNVPRMGASLAYYTLFALAPILVVAIAIGGFVFGAEAVRGEIVGQIQGLIGRQGGEAVQAMLEGAARPRTSVLATVAGVLTFSWCHWSIPRAANRSRRNLASQAEGGHQFCSCISAATSYFI